MDQFIDHLLKQGLGVNRIVERLMFEHHGRFATRDQARIYVEGRIAFAAAQKPPVALVPEPAAPKKRR